MPFWQFSYFLPVEYQIKKNFLKLTETYDDIGVLLSYSPDTPRETCRILHTSTLVSNLDGNSLVPEVILLSFEN